MTRDQRERLQQLDCELRHLDQRRARLQAERASLTTAGDRPPEWNAADEGERDD